MNLICTISKCIGDAKILRVKVQKNMRKNIDLNFIHKNWKNTLYF